MMDNVNESEGARISDETTNSINNNDYTILRSFRNMIRKSLDLTTSFETTNIEQTNNIDTPTGAASIADMSKLKFNFQSLDLYNRLNPRSKMTRNSKNNTFEDETTAAGAGATTSSISGSSSSSKSTKSCTTTPILNRKQRGSSYISLTAFNGARVYLRLSYDSNTHVLTCVIIQANKLLKQNSLGNNINNNNNNNNSNSNNNNNSTNNNNNNNDTQKQLFPTNKIQFHVNLVNKEKSPKYKTNSKEFAELIDINETFYFPNIFKNDLDYCQLLITVYTKEKFGADKLLLQANYSLSSLNLNEQFNYTTLYLEKPLISNQNTNKQLLLMSLNGEKVQLNIGLKYDALMGILTVNIIKAANLFDPVTMDKSPTTYVKLLLKLEETECKYETAVKKSTSNPVYDETFEFSIATFQVENAELFIYVYSKRVLSGKNLIGFISFDDQPVYNEYLEHLREALTESESGQFVNKWHSLLTTSSS